MKLTDRIYIAGHSGLVGSALKRRLELQGYKNLICKTRQELDLTNQQAVDDFFAGQRRVVNTSLGFPPSWFVRK